jgi:hypothetical protein
MLTTVQTWVGRATRPFSRTSYNVMAHERMRFYTLVGLALFKLLNFFGSAWDIQWHATIGRDSFFIPPHMVAAAGFVAGLSLALTAVTYETWLDRRGARMQGVVRWGGITAAPAILSATLFYLAAIFFTFLDDQWHRRFGLDVTLWSPPHLLIGLAMSGADFSLLLGLTVSARRLGLKLNWRSPYFWGFILVGAFAFEAANYWTSEAFIFGFRYGGAGLLGLLFPILVGSLYPCALLLSLRLAGRYWVIVPIFVLALILQYTGTGLSQVGFAILKPVSLIDAYILLNPQSTIALARRFGVENGFTGLIGLQQAWVMWLSAVSLGLVALLDLWPAARRRMLLAAPVYSLSLVVACYFFFQGMPVMAKYTITALDVAAAACLACAGGLLFGWLGLRLAGLVVKE